MARWMRWTAAVAGIAGATSGAAAQTAAPPATELDPVTSVGTKTRKTVVEDLNSTTRIGPEEIERQNPSKLSDILKHTPNVEAAGGPRAAAEQLNIRGLGDERIVLRVDGARSNFFSGHRGRLFLDPDLLRSVEIVRGPATLYGSGALGGAIALETKTAADFLEPDSLAGFRVKFGLNSVNKEFFQGYSAFARIGDFDFLFSGANRVGSDFRSGEIDPGKADRREFVPNSADKSLSGLAKASWNVTPGDRVFYTFQAFRSDNTIPAAANTDTTTLIASRNTQEFRHVLGYNRRHPDEPLIDLTARVYFNSVAISERIVSGASFGRTDLTDFQTLGFDLYNTSRLDFWSGRAKVALTYGIEAYRDSQIGFRNGATRAQFPDANSTVYGLYVVKETTLFDRLILMGALRWDGYGQGAQGQSGVAEGKLSKSAGIGWRPFPWVLVYGKYSEAFRAPSLTELYARGVHFSLGTLGNNNFIPNPNLRPEDAQTLEAGFGMQFRDVAVPGDRLFAKGAAFRSDVKNLIDLQVVNRLTPLPPPFFFGCNPCTSQAVNIRDARITGGEIEAGYTNRWFFAGLGASYIIGENRSTGGSIRAIPAHKLVAVLGVRHPEWEVSLGGRLTAVSDQNRVPFGDGTRPTSGYMLGDVFATWEPVASVPWLKGFRLDAGIDNIADKRYRPHLSEFAAPGRNFKIAVSYRVQLNPEWLP